MITKVPKTVCLPYMKQIDSEGLGLCSLQCWIRAFIQEVRVSKKYDGGSDERAHGGFSFNEDIVELGRFFHHRHEWDVHQRSIHHI